MFAGRSPTRIKERTVNRLPDQADLPGITFMNPADEPLEFTARTEDEIEEELAIEAEEALRKGWPTVSSARRQGHHFVAFDESVDDAVWDAIGSDDMVKLAVRKLVELARTDDDLLHALAREIARSNACGVMEARGYLDDDH